MKTRTTRVLVPMLLIAFTFLIAHLGKAQNLPISVTINTAQNVKPISPLIYGINAYVYDTEWKTEADWKVGLANVASGLNVGGRRLGGNTMTSYNWENGFSNSGTDSHNENNDFQSFITGAGGAPYSPGAALVTFHDHSIQLGASSLLDLPCAGFVATDGDGEVVAGDAAPSARWKAISFSKPGAPGSFAMSPDLADNTVYIDEELNFLVTTFGAAGSPHGIPAYELDNEPGLWHTAPDQNGLNGTHPLLHKDETTCADLLSRNAQLASAIKRLDPNAAVYGPAMWGYPEYYSFWSVYDGQTVHQPSDWGLYNIEPYTTNNTGDEYRYNHMTWVNAYLAQMKSASDIAGKRLLDVFSVHYYALDSDNPASRVQAPRSLWDPTYVENSYITQNGNGFTDGRGLQLIPKLLQSIADFYPDTKLALTEWDFGGRHDASGVIAQADALGIFGKFGVYAADYFFPVDDYIAAAFRIFRNYDGNNSTFGSTSVSAETSDISKSSSYGSLDDQGNLHLIYINKDLAQGEDVTITIGPDPKWNHVTAYSVGAASSTITKIVDMDFAGATVNFSSPSSAVSHLVFTKSNSVDLSTRVNPNCRLSQNPCLGSTTLCGSSAEAQSLGFDIFDCLGRSCGSHVTEAVQGSFSLRIDAEQLASGSYTIAGHLGLTPFSLQLLVLH
ncbi:MAG: glycoside hydrolase family 44 protein [Bacteroidota bacterium]|nr:glycoside hydrolase family 44 protein [Bacteroidota bacterium]MDP4234957.1 glycoside hydrolase family 44 protein [Bacteroidota bacterium]